MLAPYLRLLRQSGVTANTEDRAMTRNDYRIAAALAATNPKSHDLAYSQWNKDVQEIANALQVSNPKLDRTCFIMACGAQEQ